jgi:hypothetical protein
MRIAGYAICVLLGATLLSAQQNKQNTKGCDAAKEREMFATTRGFSKGGLGIINTSLYIAVKTTKNELLYGEKETWTGLDASKPEVVIFFDGKVWEPRSVPKGFDLSKSVVISFEGDKIRFFDFQEMSGGYYERIGE